MIYPWDFNFWNFNNQSFFVFALFFGILGLFAGSFLNVVADRLVTGENFLTGRSHCDFCHTKLKSWDLIPVFSFLFLGGKCRYCGHKLSWAYPLSEIFTGLAFILAYFLAKAPFLVLGVSPLFLESQESGKFWSILLLVLVFSAYIVVFLTDAKYQIIPDAVVFPVSVIVVVAKLTFLPFTEFCLNFGVAVLLMGFFLLLHVVTKGKGMGLGDAKLGFLVGIFHPFPQNIEVVFGAFILGALYSIFLLIFGKAKLKSQIAFGPFLVLSSILALIMEVF